MRSKDCWRSVTGQSDRICSFSALKSSRTRPAGPLIRERVCFYLEAPEANAVSPVKAETQSHPERLVGFTWALTFVGEAGI